MTFMHKLSCRTFAAATLVAAAVMSCERPVNITDAGTGTIAQLVVLPKTVTLQPSQATDFVAFGVTATGDTLPVSPSWSVTGGGSITDSASGKGMHYGHYKAGGQTGRFKVTATDSSSGKSDSAVAVVTSTVVPVASVVVVPAAASVTTGGTTQLVAVPLDSTGTALGGRVVTWATTNASVATVDANGLVTGVSAGAATIAATSEGHSGTSSISVTNVPVASVTVSPASTSVPAGQTAQLTATPKDSSGNTLTGRTITWTSSNTSVATVSTAGLVRGVVAGSATITATSEGKSGTSAVSVTAVTVPVATVTVSPASASVPAGQTVQVTATPKDASGTALTGRTITWASSNTSVATVTSTGLVRGVVAGSATITATSESKSGTSAVTVTAVPVASVTVSPASGTVSVGQTLQLTATAKDASGTTLAGRTTTWGSSNTSVATVSAGGLVSGVTTGSATITATSEGKSGTAAITVITTVPPPTGTCLNQTGPLVTLNGFRTSTYETSSLSASTKVDATTAQFLVDSSINVAVRIAGGNGICWSGGEILGQYPPSTPWNTMHDKYGMIPGNGGDANGFQAQNVTVFSYGDGISFDTQNDSNWVVKNVHVKYSRDDCIENDFLNAGTIDSTFLDGCYDGVSAQEYTGSPNGNNNILTMRNSLVRLQSMDAVYGGAVPNHNAFWKWSTIGPSLALYNNVFRADGPSREGNGAQMWMAPPPGKLADCKNNVMVWLGSGSFPETLPTTFNGQPCFTIMTGAAGLQYWNNAVAQWQAAHPDPLPDVAPPIVSLFSPGIAGSPTLAGTVTIIATANDDRAVVGVQLQLNGQNIGAEVTQDGASGDDEFGPTHYALTWDSHAVANGTYTLTAVARDAAGHSTTSAGVTVTVSN